MMGDSFSTGARALKGGSRMSPTTKAPTEKLDLLGQVDSHQPMVGNPGVALVLLLGIRVHAGVTGVMIRGRWPSQEVGRPTVLA